MNKVDRANVNWPKTGRYTEEELVPDLHSPSMDGMTSLMQACLDGNVEGVRILLLYSCNGA